jgi:hypothetical protein
VPPLSSRLITGGTDFSLCFKWQMFRRPHGGQVLSPMLPVTYALRISAQSISSNYALPLKPKLRNEPKASNPLLDSHRLQGIDGRSSPRGEKCG